jgi:hypothetical protein
MEARNRSDKTKSEAISGGVTTPFKPIKPLEHVWVRRARIDQRTAILKAAQWLIVLIKMSSGIV